MHTYSRFDVSWKKIHNHHVNDANGNNTKPDQILIRVECELCYFQQYLVTVKLTSNFLGTLKFRSSCTFILQLRSSCVSMLPVR